MRFNPRPWLCVVAMVSALVIGVEAVRGGADDPVAKRGEVVIKPTGRRVRVVSVIPASARAAAPASAQADATAGRALVRPALMSLEATTAARVRHPSLDRGLEYGEQSVRLPLAYDPRDSAFSGYGPVMHWPVLWGGYGHGSYGYGGYGYGGYGYRPWHYAPRYGAWSDCLR